MQAVGVIREGDEKESRVALVPEVVLGMVKDGLAQVLVQEGAGLRAGFSDQEYASAGAKIISSKDELIASADWLLAVDARDFFSLKGSAFSAKRLLGLFDPFFNRAGLEDLYGQKSTVLSLELLPRISRAQTMDVLSSQANIAGYMAVLMAAQNLTKVMPLMMTAAGTIKPARVLILGGGVAGLQAIATAKRLGAMVFAYDVRASVKEQVESLGAKFIDLKLSESGEGSGGYARSLSEEAQRELREKLTMAAKDMDVIITTAQVPGRIAPVLLNENIFSLLKKGSVIIDMASKSGGNVPGSIADEWVEKGGIKLYGADNLARLMPKDASFTYSKNIRALLDLLLAQDELNLDDEIVKNVVICHQGQWVNRRVMGHE